MIVVVLSGFVLALLAPSLYRLSARWAGCVFSIFPAVLALWFLSHMEEVVGGHGLRFVYPWIPAMGLELSFNLDGLGLLFALAITVVGTLIITYAGSYLHGHPSLPRFYLFILMFMASMLGVVLSDNLIALFVFWELTSVTSYFLIGYEHDKDTARAAALQALIVTGTGGLALMAGRAAHGTDRRQLRDIGAGRGQCRRPGAPAVSAGAGAGIRRSVHQVRPGAVPLLAAVGHGGAHARERVPPLRHHGEGRRLPAGAAQSGARRQRHLALRGHRLRRRHHAGERVPGPLTRPTSRRSWPIPR